LSPGAFASDTRETRITFFGRYQAVTRAELRWLQGLPPKLRETYREWLLPPANRALHEHWLDSQAIVQARQQRRKEDTDALMQAYPDLRSEAHLRWNWFNRFRLAYLDALHRIEQQAIPTVIGDLKVV
jgi:hypothetical protein